MFEVRSVRPPVSKKCMPVICVGRKRPGSPACIGCFGVLLVRLQ